MNCLERSLGSYDWGKRQALPSVMLISASAPLPSYFIPPTGIPVLKPFEMFAQHIRFLYPIGKF